MNTENTRENEKRNNAPEERVSAEESSGFARLTAPSLKAFTELPEGAQLIEKSDLLVYRRYVAVLQNDGAQCGYARINFNEETSTAELSFYDSELQKFEHEPSVRLDQEALESQRFLVRTVTAGEGRELDVLDKLGEQEISDDFYEFLLEDWLPYWGERGGYRQLSRDWIALGEESGALLIGYQLSHDDMTSACPQYMRVIGYHNGKTEQTEWCFRGFDGVFKDHLILYDIGEETALLDDGTLQVQAVRDQYSKIVSLSFEAKERK